MKLTKIFQRLLVLSMLFMPVIVQAQSSGGSKNTTEQQKQKEADAKRKAAEEAAKRKAAEEAAKRKAAEEAEKRKAAEEAAKRKEEDLIHEEEERIRKEELQNQQDEYADRFETGMSNGHEFTDLGLPSGVKWATCNIGAKNPGDYGNYYAWGEISTKDKYTIDNSKVFLKDKKQLHEEEIIDKADHLNRKYDVASVEWGADWRLPTEADFAELEKNCSWTWAKYGSHLGYQITGPNGRSIFIPAAGYRTNDKLVSAGENGYYWTSLPNKDSNAYALFLTPKNILFDWYYRAYGRSVRPVTK